MAVIQSVAVLLLLLLLLLSLKTLASQQSCIFLYVSYKLMLNSKFSVVIVA